MKWRSPAPATSSHDRAAAAPSHPPPWAWTGRVRFDPTSTSSPRTSLPRSAGSRPEPPARHAHPLVVAGRRSSAADLGRLGYRQRGEFRRAPVDSMRPTTFLTRSSPTASRRSPSPPRTPSPRAHCHAPQRPVRPDAHRPSRNGAAHSRDRRQPLRCIRRRAPVPSLTDPPVRSARPCCDRAAGPFGSRSPSAPGSRGQGWSVG